MGDGSVETCEYCSMGDGIWKYGVWDMEVWEYVVWEYDKLTTRSSPIPRK